MITDILRRFLLERPNVRGTWTVLDDTWQQLLNRAVYPAPIRNLLGEALAAITLLSNTIKHNGSIILQIRGDGPIHLLVVQISANGSVRGLARWNTIPADTATLPELVGKGHIAITLESEKEHERYQGIIALEGNTLAQALEGYFQQSEQLPTRLFLAANDKQCGGILLQRLPEQGDDSDGFNRVSLLLDTLTAAELLEFDAETVLYRLFHEEQVRLFDAQAVHFACSCGKKRIERMLLSLGEEEVTSIIAEQGQVEVTCEFCNARYALDAIDVKQLFLAHIAPINHTLH